MPATFQFQFWSGERQLWVPAGWTVGDQDRGSNSFIAIGRLKPGVTFERASAEMDVIGRALAAENPESNAGETVRLEALSQAGLEDLRPTLTAMLAVVGFVLLIACVNVANLMLARGAVRRASWRSAARSARAAGASCGSCSPKASCCLRLAACAGLFLAVWGTTFLVPILPGSLKYVPLRPLEQIAIDKPVLLFTSAITLLSGILFGLAPAIAAFRSDLNQPLKDSARGSTGGGRSRLRHGLVAAEVALTLRRAGGRRRDDRERCAAAERRPGARPEERARDGDVAAAGEPLLRSSGRTCSSARSLDQTSRQRPRRAVSQRDRAPAAQRRQRGPRHRDRRPARSRAGESARRRLQRGVPGHPCARSEFRCGRDASSRSRTPSARPPSS